MGKFKKINMKRFQSWFLKCSSTALFMMLMTPIGNPMALADIDVSVGGTSISIGSDGISVDGDGFSINGGGGAIFDGPGLTGGANYVQGQLDDNVTKEGDLKQLIIGWTNFLLPLAAVLAVLAVVWAGFLYITSFGDDGRTESAKKIIMWVVVGILVMAGAYAIVNVILEAIFF